MLEPLFLHMLKVIGDSSRSLIDETFLLCRNRRSSKSLPSKGSFLRARRHDKPFLIVRPHCLTVIRKWILKLSLSPSLRQYGEIDREAYCKITGK